VFLLPLGRPKEVIIDEYVGCSAQTDWGGLKEVPGEIVQAYKAQKKDIGERGPQLSDIQDEIGERLSRRVTTNLHQSLPQTATSDGKIILAVYRTLY